MASVFNAYEAAKTKDPKRKGINLYRVWCPGADDWDRYVWARSKKDAVYAVGLDAGWTAAINRPGVEMEGGDL